MQPHGRRSHVPQMPSVVAFDEIKLRSGNRRREAVFYSSFFVRLKTGSFSQAKDTQSYETQDVAVSSLKTKKKNPRSDTAPSSILGSRLFEAR